MAEEYPELIQARNEFAEHMTHHNWKGARMVLSEIEHRIAERGGIYPARRPILRSILAKLGADRTTYKQHGFTHPPWEAAEAAPAFYSTTPRTRGGDSNE